MRGGRRLAALAVASALALGPAAAGDVTVNADRAEHYSPTLATGRRSQTLAVVDEARVAGRSVCAWHVSTDGGRRWSHGTIPLPSDAPDDQNPSNQGCTVRTGSSTTFDANGRLRVAFLVNRAAVYTATAGVLPPTFEAPSRLALTIPPGYGTAPSIAAGPDDRVAVAWTDEAGAYVAMSDEGGDFGAPVLVEPGAHDAVVAFQGGRVVVASIAPDAARCQVQGQRPMCPGELVVRVSTEGGDFDHRAVVATLPGQLGRLAVSAASTGGLLALVWQDARNSPDPLAEQADYDVFFSRSTDGARTWSAPALLNVKRDIADPAQVAPGLTVSDGGRVDVAWYDARNEPFSPGLQPGALQYWDVYGRTSLDGGKTWAPERRVSPRATIVNTPSGVAVRSAPAGPFFVWERGRERSGDSARRDLVLTVPSTAPSTAGVGGVTPAGNRARRPQVSGRPRAPELPRTGTATGHAFAALFLAGAGLVAVALRRGSSAESQRAPR